jgi:hypothetical protein
MMHRSRPLILAKDSSRPKQSSDADIPQRKLETVKMPMHMTAGKSEQQLEELRKMAPMERIGEPADIARVVSFLAGPDGAG